MKRREATAWRRADMVLEAAGEIAGNHACGHVRPGNKAEDRVELGKAPKSVVPATR